MNDAKFNRIEAKEIVLMSSNEKGFIRLQADSGDGHGPQILVQHRDGSCVQLRAIPGGAVVLVRSKNAHHIAINMLEEDGGSITMTDATGRHSVWIKAPVTAGAGSVEILKDGNVVSKMPFAD